jgi:beta-aspartyl-peptidase (threonine type)
VGETGTVGAVAIDIFGNIAVATSTGGIGQKMCGRIGEKILISFSEYLNNFYFL